MVKWICLCTEKVALRRVNQEHILKGREYKVGFLQTSQIMC